MNRILTLYIFLLLCGTVAAQLGIAGKSPQHSEDLQRKARPEGERPNNHPNKLLFEKDCIYGKIRSRL